MYQDRLPFEIRDGFVGVDVNYRLDLSATNRTIAITNTSFSLRDFKLAEPDAQTNLVELSHFTVTGVSADAVARQAEIGLVSADGGKFFLLRKRNDSTNAAVAVTAPAPAAEAAASNAPGGIPALLGSITNAAALLLNSTNLWTATVHDVEFTNYAFRLEDLANSRPARLDLEDIALSVKNISNLPGTNLTVDLSLRWNTNGTIKTAVAASVSPLTANIQLDLDRLDFGTLDPYLEPMLNVLIPDSQFGLRGRIQLLTPAGQLPEISFQGDTWIDGFRAVDGAMGDDLLKWGSVRVSGIDAKLNPLGVAIKEIALDNVSASLIVETNHSINLLTALRPAGAVAMVDTNAPAATNETAASTVAKSAPAETNATPASPLPPISIGSIVISNNSAGLTDRSLTPNVNLAVLDFSGTIAGLSSSPSQRADVNLSAKVDGVGPVDISGHINPFSLTGTKDLKVTVKDFDLTPASPYSGKFAGYRIARGKLNLDLAYDIVGRNLKSKNVITLDRFTFGDKVASPDATHLPVRLAIALLKDRNGQILLDVPVEGSLDDPKFRVGKVVMHTLLNILAKAATSPFSLLGAAFGGGGEELSYQDFAPGSAVLSLGNENKLDSLVKALYERPGLQLEIAGSVDPVADRDSLRAASLEKLIRTRQWQSLRKSERAATTPGQVRVTPEQHAAWVKKLYSEAVGNGVINENFLAAHTNLAAIAAQIKPASGQIEKSATLLMKGLPGAGSNPSAAPAAAKPAQVAGPADPKEILLLASLPVTDDDLAALASDRAKAVRSYILATGRVEAGRIFLAENKSGGVRSDGCRAYLQLQ